MVSNLLLNDKCTNFFRLKFRSVSLDQVNKAMIVHVDGGNQAIHWHSIITAKLCCNLAMYSYSIMQFNKTVEVHVYMQ